RYYDLKIDFSQNQTYSISVQSQSVLSKLDEDLTIYTLYSVGREDATIREILSKYKSYSDHISAVNIDPTRNPTFVNQFAGENESIREGYIIVSNADQSKFRVLDQYDQYSFKYDQSGYGQTIDQVIVEGSLTKAVMYITADKLQRALFLEGHGEPGYAASAALRNSLTDQNYEVIPYNPLTSEDTLQPGDIVVVLAPASDINDTEREILKAHITQGGRFLFAFNPQYGSLPNFESLLELYGVRLGNGVIIEGDRSFYALPQPYYLLPDIQSHAATRNADSSGIPVMVPASGAVYKPDVAPSSSIKIESLLKTSASAWLEAVDTTDITQNEGDETGPFDVGLAVTKTDSANKENDVQFIVFNSADFLQFADQLTTFSNADLLDGCMQWLSVESETIYVRGKVTDKPVLYFTSASQIYTVIVLAWPVLSILIFAAGIIIYLRRRHL
ncbi:MAG: GldG family protein, partial [Clostridiales bacterium]|nr:GldG family protein [Clostridiales bacterium]